MMKLKIILFSLFFGIAIKADAQQSDAMAKRIQAMSATKDPLQNVIAMHSIIKDFKLDSLKNAEDIDVLKGQVALSYLNAGQFPQFETYINTIKNKFNQTSFLNMAAYNLIKTNKLAYAAVIAKQTIDLYESYKDDPLAKPINFEQADWNRFMQMAAYPYYESYATVLHLKGENKKALFYEEKAIHGKEDLMPSSIELYTALLVADGHSDKAYDLLLKMISLGKANIKMNVLFEKLTMQKFGNEAKAKLFLDSIQRNLNQLYSNELIKKMIVDVTAPDFSLLDLNGKRVTLADFKGKIVVLDFWATWCVPCIASMPAMKIIEKRHPEIVFLFIATQETDDGATLRVKTYVKTNQFPIKVLMDEPASADRKYFKTASAYKVTGIPTKVVIDQKGKLRFITTGYPSDNELMNELEAMISMAKTQ